VHSKKQIESPAKLGWEETYQDMVFNEDNEWSDWQDVDADLDNHL